MKKLHLALSKKDAFSVCRDSLSSLNFDMEEENLDKSFIRASVNASFLSFGNDIEILFHSAGQHITIEITSESTAALQLIDWGKNDDLENELAEKIIELSGT